MGCWNGTCMISQQPIFEGDKVILIPIAKAVNELPQHSICYSTELYRPIPIILEGTYNDYGSIENVTGDSEKFIKLILNNTKSTKDQILNEYREDTEIESFLSYVERDEMDNIGFIMIHKKLFESLIANYPYMISLDKIVKNLIEESNSFSSFQYTINNFIMIKDCNKKSLENLIKINYAIDVLRKTWMPQSGAGSQEGICDIHIEFNKFYDDFITEKYTNEEEE